MPWTDSRSRDEWLAEVTRRGERLRRRRRIAASSVGAIAMLGPALAVASLSVDGQTGHQFQVTAAGPSPTAGQTAGSLPSVLGGEEAMVSTTLAGALGEAGSVAPTGPLYSTTTTEVHRRVSSINGVAANDDPVVRLSPTSTIGPIGNDAVRSSPPLAPTPTPTLPPTDPSLSACPVPEVRVTVSMDRGSYASGDTVRWSSTLENRSASTCLVSGRAFFSVEDTAGRTVGSFAYTADFMLPVKAEPGRTITNSGTWDQKNCSGPACVPVPPGTYVVVAGWTEGGAYIGRGSFSITG